MLQLTGRQKDILLLLIKSTEPVNARWIANNFGVSDRTIRNDIKILLEEEENLGAKISSKRAKGYEITITNAEKFIKNVQEIANEQQSLSRNFNDQKNRISYILKRFLLAKDYIKLEVLEDEMFISKSTIQNDLRKVREILEDYNLDLENRPHYGTVIKGEEFMKRKCLSNLVYSENKNLPSYNLCKLLDINLYEKIKAILIETINNFRIVLSDLSLENLTIHIVIACKRIETGFIVERLVLPDEKDYSFEEKVALEIIEKVEKETGIEFPEAEINYIVVHLIGTKIITDEGFSDYDSREYVLRIVLDIVKEIKAEYNWDFSRDYSFINGLTDHLLPLLNRIRYSLSIKNPLLKEIKTKYPLSFEVAVTAGKCLEKYTKKEITEDEIGYLAVHIAAAMERMKMKESHKKKVLIVCATGIGSARLLHFRLENEFSHEIEVVDIISYYQLSDYPLSDIELIISTIPIGMEINKPILYVNTFLGEEDIRKINHTLAINTLNQNEYLSKERVFVNLQLETKDEVIKFMAQQLYKQGLVGKEYVHLVFEREKMASTCFGNLVAIPHPIKSVTSKTFWTLCTLKKPIQWDKEQMVQCVILLNIDKDNDVDLFPMYQQLIHITKNQTIVEKLIDSKTPDDVLAVVNGLFN